MNSFLNMGDDGTALVGCAIALLVCGITMSLSYYVGRAAKRSSQKESSQLETFAIATRQENKNENDRKVA
ncbi:hypothetical protein MNBD_PLANCTO02-1102 [hydrothermal vent metagenome]|uniref:Uncharacterized protein n=1 Tax=hydrothermal vent metagenome TaxID=652676 RepID=A0A3B1DQ51_9ZZZZ